MPAYPVADATIESAYALRELIDDASDSMESEAILSEPVVSALVDRGIFGVLAPKAVGCSECEPSAAIDILSEVGYADGATGWVVQTTAVSTALAGAFLGESAAEEVFSSERYTCAGSGVPPGKAERVEGGYRIEGRFTFGSGTNHCGWVLGLFAVERNGEPVAGADGDQQHIFGIVPVRNVELLGNWDVMGLVATGSNDYLVPEQVITDDWAFDLSDGPAPPPVRGGELYRLGPDTLSALAHGSLPLGLAQRALDEYVALAHTTKRRNASHTTVQRDFADATALHGSAKAFVHDAFSRLYDAALVDRVTPELRARAHLASAHAVHTCAEVTRRMYLAGGSSALRNGSRIQRCFRDAHGASQHVLMGERVPIEYGELALVRP
jgi:alkylation response protein AidB-like acyl-CoA dehydrogenase